MLSPQYPQAGFDFSAIPYLLEHPVGSSPFSRFLHGATSLLVIVSDRTRPAKYELWLPQVIDFALATNERLKISFLVATGTHPPESAQPINAILPSDLAREFPVFIHSADAGGPSGTRFAYLGQTSRGTPVFVNQLLLESDRILATGALNFHYYAGFTGGRKAIVPGCAARETIEANHSLVLSPMKGRGRHPQARSALLALNPVSEDLSEAVVFLSTPVFLINVILTPHQELVSLIAGDLHRAHRFAASQLYRWGAIPVSRSYDLVIASPGGHPYDASYYQAHKAFDEVHRISAPDGKVILLAQLPNGIGDPLLTDALKTTSLALLEERLQSRYDHCFQIAYSHRLKLKTTGLLLVSEAPREVGLSLGVPIVPDIASALASLDGFQARSMAIVPSVAGVHFTGVAARL